MKQYMTLVQWTGLVCAGLVLVFLVGHHPQGTLRRPMEPRNSGPLTLSELVEQSRSLDAALERSRQLSQELKRITCQLEQGRWNLEQATKRAEKMIPLIYPPFMRFVATNYHGATNQATLAHYLLRRVIFELGGPVIARRTATILAEYLRAYHPDRTALADLGLEEWPVGAGWYKSGPGESTDALFVAGAATTTGVPSGLPTASRLVMQPQIVAR